MTVCSTEKMLQSKGNPQWTLCLCGEDVDLSYRQGARQGSTGILACVDSQTGMSVLPYCAKKVEGTHTLTRTRTRESLKPGVGLDGKRDLSVRVRKAIIGLAAGSPSGSVSVSELNSPDLIDTEP